MPYGGEREASLVSARDEQREGRGAVRGSSALSFAGRSADGVASGLTISFRFKHSPFRRGKVVNF